MIDGLVRDIGELVVAGRQLARQAVPIVSSGVMKEKA